LFSADVRKLATEPEAEVRRTPARPAVRAGKETLTMAAMMATTMSISSRVTPGETAPSRSRLGNASGGSEMAEWRLGNAE